MRVSRGYRIVPPLRGSTPFCFLPGADALGYLLDAPNGAESLGRGRYQSPGGQFSLHQEFLERALSLSRGELAKPKELARGPRPARFSRAGVVVRLVRRERSEPTAARSCRKDHSEQKSAALSGA